MAVEKIWDDCLCDCHEGEVTECVGNSHCFCVPCTCPSDEDVEYCKLSAVRDGKAMYRQMNHHLTN